MPLIKDSQTSILSPETQEVVADKAVIGTEMHALQEEGGVDTLEYQQRLDIGGDANSSLIAVQQRSRKILEAEADFTQSTSEGDVLGASDAFNRYLKASQEEPNPGLFQEGVDATILDRLSLPVADNPEAFEMQKQDIMNTVNLQKKLSYMRAWRRRIEEAEGEQSFTGMVLDFIMTDLNPVGGVSAGLRMGDRTLMDSAETAFEKELQRITSPEVPVQEALDYLEQLEKDTANGSGLASRNLDLEKLIVAGLSMSQDEGQEIDDRTVSDAGLFTPWRAIAQGTKGLYRGLLEATNLTKSAALKVKGVDDFIAGVESAETVQFINAADAVEETLPSLMRIDGKPNPSFGEVSSIYESLPNNLKQIVEESKYKIVGESVTNQAERRFIDSLEESFSNKPIVNAGTTETGVLEDFTEFYAILGKGETTKPFTQVDDAIAEAAHIGLKEGEYTTPFIADGYYIRYTKPVSEAKLVGALELGVAENIGPIGEFWKSPLTYISSKSVHTGAKLKSKRIGTLIRESVDSIGTLSPAETKVFTQASIHNQKTGRWFESASELATFVERRGLTYEPRLWKAYSEGRQLNDLAFVLTNRRAHGQLKGLGYKTLDLSKTKLVDEIDGTVVTGKPMPVTRAVDETVYDLEKGVTIEAGELTAEAAAKMDEAGYSAYLLAIDNEVAKATGGTRVVLAKKGLVQVEELRWQQMGYTAGWRRQYDEAYSYVLQQSNKATSKSGAETLLNPTTVTMTKTVKEAMYAQKIWSSIDDIYIKFKVDRDLVAAKAALRKVDTGVKWEFIEQAVKSGKYKPGTKFEVARKGEDIASVAEFRKKKIGKVGLDFNELQGELNDLVTTGAMTYSRQKSILTDVHGKALTTIDPFTALQKNLGQAVDVSTVSKTSSMMQRQWVNAHLPKAARTEPLNVMFEHSLAGFNKSKKQLNEANKQRNAIRRLINDSGAMGDWWRQSAKDYSAFAHEALGGGKVSKAIFSGAEWFASRNYPSFLKSISYNSFLGFNSPHNFIVQGSTGVVIAAAAGPTKVLPLLARANYLQMASLSPHKSIRKALLNDFGKQFDVNDSWLKMLEAYEKGGYKLVDETNALIEAGGSGHILTKGRISKATGKASRASRWTYTVSEGWSRAVAMARAWDELGLDAATATRAATTDESHKLVKLVEKYSFDMFESKQNLFQRGIFSPAFQFVTFSVRLGEAVMPKVLGGSNLWTGTQKAALGSTLFLMFGDKTTPFSENYQAMAESMFGKNSELYDIATLGFVDYTFKRFGLNTNFRGRVGPGGFIEQTLDRMIDEDKSLIENFFGASSGVTYDLLKGTYLAASLALDGKHKESRVVVGNTLTDNITSAKSLKNIFSAIDNKTITTRSGDVAYPAKPDAMVLQAIGVESEGKMLVAKGYELDKEYRDNYDRAKKDARRYALASISTQDEAESKANWAIAMHIIANANLTEKDMNEIIFKVTERRNWWETTYMGLLEKDGFKNARELSEHMHRLYKETYEE